MYRREFKLPRGRPPGSKNKVTIDGEERAKRAYKKQADKRFDFSDIVDQPCFYTTVGKCSLPAEIVTIRMLTSKPYFLCLDHAISYLRACRKTNIRLTSNADDISPGTN